MAAADVAAQVQTTQLGNVLTGRQLTKLDELMRSRTPTVMNPFNEWSTAAQQFEVSPVPRNLARLTIASRNLSNNLSDTGITISPGDLVRSITTSLNEQ